MLSHIVLKIKRKIAVPDALAHTAVGNVLSVSHLQFSCLFGTNMQKEIACSFATKVIEIPFVGDAFSLHRLPKHRFQDRAGFDIVRFFNQNAGTFGKIAAATHTGRQSKLHGNISVKMLQIAVVVAAFCVGITPKNFPISNVQGEDNTRSVIDVGG